MDTQQLAQQSFVQEYNQFGIFTGSLLPLTTSPSGLSSLIPNTVNGSVLPSSIGAGNMNSQTSLVAGYLQSSNFKTGVTGWRIDAEGNAEFASGYFRGDITGASGTFTGALNVGTNAWHVDSSGNMWWGNSATFAGSTINISSAGAVNLTTGTFSGTISGSTITGGTITGSTIKTSDVTYPSVLINTSGITLHGEKLILRDASGTLFGSIGSTPTYGIRILAESGKSIQLTTGDDFNIGAPTGGNFFSYNEGTNNLFISPPGILNLGSGSDIIAYNDIKPNTDGGISLGDADQQIQNIYIKNQLRFSAMASTPVSGNVAGNMGTLVVGGVTKLVIFDGTNWVSVGSQT